MTASKTFAEIEFGGPALYRIVVQGSVSAHWSGRLAGMTVSVTSRGGRAPRTTLVGPLRDQAELSGVLDTLHSLHLPIIRVEEMHSQDSKHKPSQSMPEGEREEQ